MHSARHMLHRNWITFEKKELVREPGEILLDLTNFLYGAGFGITGYSLEDATSILHWELRRYAALPPIASIIEDVDVSTLDARHVLINIGVPVWRGMWYPRLNV